MSGGYSEYEVFTDWVLCCAVSIQNACCMIEDRKWKEREEEYLSVYRKYRKNHFSEMTAFLAEELGENISDVLGAIYMAGGMGSKLTGQFFTPFHLSDMTAHLAFDPKDYDGSEILMNEPSIGGGGMVIAMAKVLKENGIDYQKKLKVVGQDIDLKAVHMSYVQLSLLGIDAVIHQENTLQMGKPSRTYRSPRNMGALI